MQELQQSDADAFDPLGAQALVTCLLLAVESAETRQAQLELVQAAVFAGATYIAIDTHPDRLVVAWVGTPPLLEDQLEHLLDYLFADTANPGQRHLVQVAIAVNAMLRDEGGRVRIDADDSGLTFDYGNPAD